MINMENSNDFDNSLKLLVKSSLIVLIGIFLSKIFTYLYRIIIARYFGAEFYGVFSLAVIIFEWFVILASFGMGYGLVRYIPLYRGKKEFLKIKFIFKISTFLALFISLIISLFLFSLSEIISVNIFNDSSLIPFLKFFSLAIPPAVLLSLFIHTLQAYERIGLTSFLNNILMTGIKLFLLITLIFLGLQLQSIILSFVLATFIVFIISFFILNHYVLSSFPNDSIPNSKKSRLLKEVFSYSLPLLFAGITWKLFHWTDSILIGYFSNSLEVGLYNAAVPIAFLLGISSQLFIQLFFPLITKEYSQGRNDVIKQLSKQVNKWIFALNLPLILLIIVFPKAFLNILFGAEFIPAYNALRFFAIGMFFLNLSEVPNRLVSMKGKSKTILVDILLLTIFNIFLNYILIPRWGINGAAIATTISLIFLTILLFIQAYIFTTIFSLRRKTINIFLAGIISLTILITIKYFIESNIISLVILSLFFLISYFLLLLLFKGLDKNDLMILKSFFRKLIK
jgi:O-antigen/teichoic acid export membrane protein